MDRQSYVQRRKGRYMAQTLEEFERLIEPHISQEAADEFKGVVRRKMSAFAIDVEEVLDPNWTPNGAAIEIRDRLSPSR